jgi:hypothetical protein
MLFRLVRPVKRSSSSKSQFVRRIPRMCESEQRAGRCRYPSAQRSFTSPSRPEPKPSAFSLRTSDRSETKTRQAEAAAYLERPFISNKPGRSRTIWRPGAMRAQANYCRRPPSIRRLLPSGPSSFGWRGSQVTPCGSTSRMRTISALPTISLASKRPPFRARARTLSSGQSARGCRQRGARPAARRAHGSRTLLAPCLELANLRALNCHSGTAGQLT